MSEILVLVFIFIGCSLPFLGFITIESKCARESYELELEVVLLYGDAKLPTKAHEPDAGDDLYCYLNQVDYPEQEIIVPAKQRVNIPCGFRAMIPDGWVGIIENRSGLSTKNGILKLAGVIDAGFTGQWLCCILNSSDVDFVIKHGDRMAQVLYHRVPKRNYKVVTEFSLLSKRGDNGFASTGR